MLKKKVKKKKESALVNFSIVLTRKKTHILGHDLYKCLFT